MSFRRNLVRKLLEFGRSEIERRLILAHGEAFQSIGIMFVCLFVCFSYHVTLDMLCEINSETRSTL